MANDVEAALPGKPEEKCSTRDAPESDLQSPTNGSLVGETSTLSWPHRIILALRRFEHWTQGGHEAQGSSADRVLEDDRMNPPALTMMTLWFSVNMNLQIVMLGIYGALYGLSVGDTIMITVIGGFLGACGPAFVATLAPQTGLRQVAFSRYTFGRWGAKLCALLNLIVLGGYGIVNTIISGQIISAVADMTVPTSAGIIITTLVAWVVSALDLRYIHVYNKYAWILIFVFLCILFVQSSSYFSSTPDLRYVEGTTYIGSCLSLFSICFGGSMTWATIAGDYYVHYRPDASKLKIFVLTHLGIFLPTAFLSVMGSYIGGIYASNEAFATAYNERSIGGIIIFFMTPAPWGKCAGTFFALSFVASLATIMYSCSISVLILNNRLATVPRLLWNTLAAGIILGISWGGMNSLLEIISNFVALLGYWVVIFVFCLAIEHFWFRPRLEGYNIERWADKATWPLGLAGISTLSIGYGLTFLGMCQTWFVGPLARLVGDYGGDLGPYIAIASCFLIYPAVRSLEIKKLGR